MLDKNIFIEHLIREYQKMNSFEKIEISPQEIMSIRNEYHQLLTLKENCLHTITELHQIHLPTLSEFCEKYKTDDIPHSTPIHIPEIICDICHDFSSQTRKGINSHKRKCQKNTEKVNVENIKVEEIDIENIDIRNIEVEKIEVEKIRG